MDQPVERSSPLGRDGLREVLGDENVPQDRERDELGVRLGRLLGVLRCRMPYVDDDGDDDEEERDRHPCCKPLD